MCQCCLLWEHLKSPETPTERDGGVNMDRCGRRGGVCSEGWVRGQLNVSIALHCIVGCYGNLCVCQYHVVYSDMDGGAQIHC